MRPLSTWARHSSQTRKGFPAVTSLIVSASSGTPPLRRTNSVTSSPDSPPSRSRTTSSERRRSASVSASASGISASVSRNVASSSSRTRPAARARWRISASVGASAQCASSITSSTGCRRPMSSSRLVTAVCRRWRSVSGSVAAGGAGPPISRASSGPTGTSVTRARCSSASTNGPYGGRTTASHAPYSTSAPSSDAPTANSRTSRLLPEPASPPTIATRRPSPAAHGTSERSIVSSRARPTNGNAELKHSGPGSVVIVRSDHRGPRDATPNPVEVGQGAS